ncbi:MAG: carbamoyltransferase HypF, partial [Thermoprotei archaeon]
MAVIAKRVRITGIVQGVGFRPFVYRIAVSRGLGGYVLNLGGSEVEVWVEGSPEAIRGFLEDLCSKRPPPARIEELVVEDVRPNGYAKFEIRRSGSRVRVYSQVPPDFGVCSDCLREVLDPSSRWYRYPFNSCAWCGPRFSMMYGVPYDRRNTAMREFPMCEDCLREYRDPTNMRRFHAQGISCPKCGPRLLLVNCDGEEIRGDPIAEAAKLIDEGYIVAVKGIGGFHIAALATDDEVVEELRKRKRRPQKPFALMALSIDIV